MADLSVDLPGRLRTGRTPGWDADPRTRLRLDCRGIGSSIAGVRADFTFLSPDIGHLLLDHIRQFLIDIGLPRRLRHQPDYMDGP